MFASHSEENSVGYFCLCSFVFSFFPLRAGSREGTVSRLYPRLLTCKSHSCRTVKVSVSFFLPLRTSSLFWRQSDSHLHLESESG